MEPEARRSLIADLPAGYPPEIARWLWVFADTRRRTLEVLDGVDASRIDEPGPGGNSIATILAHVAVIETDWLYVEILGEDYPADLLEHLPPEVRDEQGHLLATPGLPLSRYLDGLAAVRAKLVERVGALSPEDLYRVRSLPQYDVNPEWVLNHLVQHEAEHRAEISLIRAVFEGRQDALTLRTDWEIVIGHRLAIDPLRAAPRPLLAKPVSDVLDVLPHVVITHDCIIPMDETLRNEMICS